MLRVFRKEDGLFSLLYVFTHSHIYISMDLVYFILWVIILSFFIFILPAVGLHCSVRVSSVAVHGLSCPMACGILVSRSGIEPLSSALEGGFLTTEPAGMSLIICFVGQILPASASASSFRLVAVSLSISPYFCSGHFFTVCYYEILQA